MEPAPCVLTRGFLPFVSASCGRALVASSEDGFTWDYKLAIGGKLKTCRSHMREPFVRWTLEASSSTYCANMLTPRLVGLHAS